MIKENLFSFSTICINTEVIVTCDSDEELHSTPYIYRIWTFDVNKQIVNFIY